MGRWILATAMVFEFLVCSAMCEADTAPLDGAWWNALSQTQRLVAVQGMLAGYDAGYNDGISPGSPQGKTTAQMVDILDKLAADLKRRPALQRFNISTIAERISRIYRDHTELASAPAFNFLACSATETGNCAQIVAKLDSNVPQRREAHQSPREVAQVKAPPSAAPPRVAASIAPTQPIPSATPAQPTPNATPPPPTPNATLPPQTPSATQPPTSRIVAQAQPAPSATQTPQTLRDTQPPQTPARPAPSAAPSQIALTALVAPSLPVSAALPQSKAGPISIPASTATTQPVGVTGSTLVFPTIGGASATLVVPQGMPAGAIATLTATNGPLWGAYSNDAYGPTQATFTIAFNAAAAFRTPALSIHFVSPPMPPDAVLVMSAVGSTLGDNSVYPPGTNPLATTPGGTCIALKAGQSANFSVIAALHAFSITSAVRSPDCRAPG